MSDALRRADHSSRGVLPTVMRRCVWSRNLKNGEAMGPSLGRSATEKKECLLKHVAMHHSNVWQIQPSPLFNETTANFIRCQNITDRTRELFRVIRRVRVYQPMQLNEEMAGCSSDPVSALISSVNSYVVLSELYVGSAPPPPPPQIYFQINPWNVFKRTCK